MDSKTLTRSLVAAAGCRTANALNADESRIDNATLQEIIGDANTLPLSWSSQFGPSDGGGMKKDMNSPVQGDEIFWSGLMDGARFSDKNGAWWDIVSAPFEGAIVIQNVWYPRIKLFTDLQSLRTSIHSWLEPFLQRVPPPAPDLDYATILTRVVK